MTPLHYHQTTLGMELSGQDSLESFLQYVIFTPTVFDTGCIMNRCDMHY